MELDVLARPCNKTTHSEEIASAENNNPKIHNKYFIRLMLLMPEYK